MTGKLVLTELLEHISDGDSVMVTATGRSMLPTFRPDVDRIVLSPVSADRLKVGDVVFFNRGDAVCVHRIIERNGDNLVIRGDGNGLNALERVKVSAVFAIVSGGTMRGGKPFSTRDSRWKANTRRVMRFFPLIAFWHRISRILRSYPMSIVVLSVLLYLSFFNPNETPLPVLEVSDKIIHFLMYFGTGSIFWLEWTLVHRRGRPSLGKGFVFCFVIPVMVGALTELGQEYLTECRSGDWLDFVANLAGVSLAALFSYVAVMPFVRKKLNRRK